MSFNELAITIIAENLASAEFTRVASDAAAMASSVSGQSIVLHAENLASPEIARVAEEAAAVKANIEASPITISFEPITVPSIPSIDVSPVEEVAVAFNEAGVQANVMGESVKAVGPSLVELQAHAETTTVSLRTIATAFGSIAHVGTALLSIAGDMGIVDRETAKWARTLMSVFTLMGAYVRMKHYLTVLTTGHTAAVAVNTTAQTANASSSLAVAVAHKIKAAATWLAVHAQNALNISHATFLALTGVGIGVIIAAAAAMAYFASQMNAATESVKEYNAVVAETPTRTRSIVRAGEEELYRRGVEP
ncbi:MAG: hypothetical protein QXE74_08185 [Candidatus Bathyarchaeia archaeon]